MKLHYGKTTVPGLTRLKKHMPSNLQSKIDMVAFVGYAEVSLVIFFDLDNELLLNT